MEFNKIIKNVKVYGLEESIKRAKYPMSVNPDTLSSELTKGIKSLAQSRSGEGHDQWLTGVIVQFDLTFSVKAWTEAERYHFFDFVSSQSTMHRITKFELDEAYIDYVDPRIIEIMKEKISSYNEFEQMRVNYSTDETLIKEWQQQLDKKYLEIQIGRAHV